MNYLPRSISSFSNGNSFFLGDVLVFLNEKNLLKPPVTLTNDRIKSELTSLRRHHKPIRIGICRCSDRSLFNHTTIQHLGSLTFDDFQKLSLDDLSIPSPNESHKSLTIVDEIRINPDSKKHSKKNKPLVQKRSTSPNRDSGFIETDGTNISMVTDRSVISNFNKRRSKLSLEKSEDESMDTHKSLDSLQHSISKTTTEPIKIKPSGLIYSTQVVDKQRRNQHDLPIQTVTDACFIYRHQVVKHETTDDEKAAIILRGREIAHEAANTPAIPSSMPNYTRDQIRELYGDLDKKTRRLQEDEYTLHSSIKNSYNEKPQWKLASPTTTKLSDECPLPKFHLDKTSENEETLLMAAYLSTGLKNSHTKPIAPVDNFHTVMMNASAKVNEWAYNNEIYLTPIEKDIIHSDRPTISSFDVHLNLKKLAGTPTGSNDRPTFLEGIEQQTTNHSNEILNTRGNRRSIRRQQHTTDTTSSSPDSVEIALETTPSTPGSCGMYLEPYMRHGYDLPSSDHHIRDSSWQYDDIEESIKNITPIESPTTTPKLDIVTLPSLPMTSRMIETDSLIDLDDGGTNSYHTAKDSRLDQERQSTLSVESDETTSTLHQSSVRDDLINNILSPEGSFYYDALASPSQTNQQITSAVDKQNLLIDNLTNLLEQIETFNRTNHSLSTIINEEKSRLPPEREESTNDIDQLTTIVQRIHESNQPKVTNTMDNLLFIYDDIDDEQQSPPLMDNVVETVPTDNQTPSSVNNLLFIYEDIVTPTEEESKPIATGSNEWSYDNLTTEQVDTDHLGMVIHEALTARFQKPIQFKQTNEAEKEDTTAEVQKPIIEMDDEDVEAVVDTDHLGTIVHEALAARYQKPIKFKQPNEVEKEDSTAEVQKPVNEIDDESPQSVFDTDHLGTIVHEALAARFQKPIKFKQPNEVQKEDSTTEVQKPVNEIDDESPQSVFDTDHLGTIVHEALAARFQKPIKFKQTNEAEKDDATTEMQQPINKIDDENAESIFDTDHLGTIVHEALVARSQKPIKTKITDRLEPEIPTEESQEFIDEPAADTDNLATIVHETLTTRSQKPIKIQPIVEFNQEFINEPTVDTSEHNIPPEPISELNQESVSSNFEKPPDESPDNTHTSETIVYEIELLNRQPNLSTSESASPPPPVTNLSQIVSDSLLTSSKYHRHNQDEHKIEFNITQQPPVYDEEIYEEYGYRRTSTDPETDDVVEKFEELCRHYSSTFNQYENTRKKFDDEINQFENQIHQRKEQSATPTSETTSEELITTIERLIDIPDETTTTTTTAKDSYLSLTVKRQPNSIGKYGFDFEELVDGKIKISSIINENYCPNLNIGDEIISINNNRTFKTRDQCQLIFDSLWKHFYEEIPITVIKSGNIPIMPSK